MYKLILFFVFSLFTVNSYSCRIRASNTSNRADNKIEKDFEKFWTQFQQLVKIKDKTNIKSSLIFPIYAINIVDFEYACDCDTANYIKRSEKYNDIVISDDNFDNYYDFVFSEKFTKVISQISFGDFNEGIEFDPKEKVSYSVYTIRPTELGISKCINDNFIRIILVKGEEDVKIKIIGIY